ncbi:MAG: CDP-alcohol phosphatidyltransferase family protein [Desulfobacterales bacterium]|nr:CDP-alcohol phosphatidyltransferase family protein [Desulfobacterales bacterium]
MSGRIPRPSDGQEGCTVDTDDRARLSRSIYLSVAGFFAFQSLLFLVFFRSTVSQAATSGSSCSPPRSFTWPSSPSCWPSARTSPWWRAAVSLARVNLANEVTLARMSTLPTLLILIVASKEYSIQTPLLVLVALVFVTDFADGWISRASRQVTFMGRMLDAISDYCVLIVLSIVFYYYELIPGWFFWVVIFRLVFQGAGMAVL